MHLSLLGLTVSAVAVLFVMGVAQGADAPVYDIPRMDKVVLDGDAADWGDGGFRSTRLRPRAAPSRPPRLFHARVRLGWNDEGLLLVVFWHDASWEEARNRRRPVQP